jgi:hypothetical protein
MTRKGKYESFLGGIFTPLGLPESFIIPKTASKKAVLVSPVERPGCTGDTKGSVVFVFGGSGYFGLLGGMGSPQQ